MEAKYLSYLHNISKHVGGPLKANAPDRLTMRAMIAVSGVLSRVIANTESRPLRAEQLRAAVKRWLPDLSRLPADGDLAGLVRQLGESVEKGGALDLEAVEVCLGRIAARLSERQDADSQRLLLDIVELEYRSAQALENKISELMNGAALQGGGAAQSGLSGEQQGRLLALLRAQCGEAEGLGITSVKVNPGGLSKQTIFVELVNNRVLPTQIVLRQDLASSPLDTTVVDEFPLLQVLHRAGIKVPRPLALDAAGAVAGSPLLVVSRAEGTVIGDGINIFDKEDRSGCALALAREMAKYHAIPIESFSDSVPGKHKSNIEIMRTDIEALKQKWDANSASSIVVDAAIGWLLDHLDCVGEQRSLIHGDLRFHNVMVEGSEIAALLDWEVAMIANPALDLAYVYQDIKKLVDWQAFLDAYAAAGGIVPARETLDFYLVRTELFISVNVASMEEGFLAGAFDELLTVYGSISFPQYCRYLLAERLRAAMTGTPL